MMSYDDACMHLRIFKLPAVPGFLPPALLLAGVVILLKHKAAKACLSQPPETPGALL